MADEPSSATEQADDAAQAAAGLRATARWIASAFAGIPSLAVVGALIRAPGDAGFDKSELIAGVLLAAAGAVIGILAYARVLAPIGLVDAKIEADVMNELPEARFDTYAELRQELETARDIVGNLRVEASDRAGRAELAEAQAVEAEATVKLLEEVRADEKPPDPAKLEEAVLARRNARDLRVAAGTAKGTAAIAAKELSLREQILDSLEDLRRGAYGLQAGRTIRDLYCDANIFSVFAVGLVAAGVILLALAPKPKAVEAPPAPKLVSLTLTPAGQAALGCQAKMLYALRVGGDEKTPTVITLPGSKCPVRTVKFLTTGPKPLGSLNTPAVVNAK